MIAAVEEGGWSQLRIQKKNRDYIPSTRHTICLGFVIAADEHNLFVSRLHCFQIKHSVFRQCRSCSLLLVADESFHREVKKHKIKRCEKNIDDFIFIECVHRKIRFTSFPSPAWDVTNQTPPGQE